MRELSHDLTCGPVPLPDEKKRGREEKRDRERVLLRDMRALRKQMDDLADALDEWAKK